MDTWPPEEAAETTRTTSTAEDMGEMMAGDPHGTGPRGGSNMFELDFSPNNLMEEIDGDGWLNVTRPQGAGMPRKLPTVGGRGMENRPLSSDARSDPRAG